MFRSTNSGNTWASYVVNGDDFKCVYSYGNDVWIAGENGKIYKTAKDNSPVNFVQTATGNTFNGIAFADGNVGFACGDGGVVYKTIDGGSTWSSSNSGISSVKLKCH